MTAKLSDKDMQFLSGGGEMGQLTRTKDWSKTPVGPINQWPQSLRSIVSLLLNSKFPMFLWWGPELTCFYNDAYRPSLGNNGKHPGILGMPAEQAWPEIWPIIKPLIDQVLAGGESTWSEDQLIPIYRNGKMEDVYWTFSYSAVRNDAGAIAGVFVNCTETTEKVHTMSVLSDSKDQLQFAIDAAELGTWDYNPITNTFTANNRLKEWFGLPPESEIDLSIALNAITESERGAVAAAIQQSLEYSSGGRFNIEYTIVQPVTGKHTIVKAKGQASFDNNKQAYRLNGTLQDITAEATAQKKLQDSKDQLQFALDATELGTFDYYPETNTFIGNNRLKELFGVPVQTQMDLQHAMEGVAEKDRQRIHDAIQAVLQPTGSGLYDQVHSIIDPVTKAERFVRGKGKASFDKNGTACRFTGTVQDITEQVMGGKKNEEGARRVRDIVENAPSAIAVYVGREMRIELANQTMMDIWGKGYSVVGRLYTDVLPELATQKIFEQIDDVFTTGKSLHIKNQRLDLVVGGKLQPFYFNYSFTPLFDSTGKVYAVMNTGVDITDQITALRKIAESEARFRNNVEQAPVGITVFRGQEFVVEMVNESYLQIVGRNKEQFVDRPLFDSLPEVESTVRPLLEKVYTTGETFNGYEYPIMVNRYGKEALGYFNFVYQALRELNGDISGIMVVVTDVTESIKAKQELEQTSNRLHMALEAGKLGSFELDLVNRIVTISQQCRENFGSLIPAQITHEQMRDMIIPEDREIAKIAFSNAIHTHSVYNAEYRILWPDGSLHWINTNGLPYYDDEGKPLKMVGVTIETTQQKLFEQELARKVQQQTAEVNQKNIELEKMNAELKSFAYVSSHDLQEPLRKIQLFADRILRSEQENLTEDGRYSFERMQVAAKRMQTLIEDLLAYSRTSTADRTFETISLGQLVKEVEEELKETIHSKQATIIAEGTCPVRVVHFQFRQLLHNLLTNSLKFSMPNRPPVIRITCQPVTGTGLQHLHLQANKNYHHIQISDNGIGFEPQHAAKIFEVFQRLHGQNEYQGTGIGLAIVKKIIENHDGAITATGALNEGATFDIYVPV